MWAELEQRLVVIKADKTLCDICGKKYTGPGKMRAHGLRRHREAFTANLRESGDTLRALAPSSSVAESPVSDFLEPLIDGDEGTVDFALQAMIP